ncbi:MAG: hypothetical protein HQL54_03975 [Magnetococcales bacterium]|nr:hypothetical protein [Magnetococcales bacterium]
MSQPVPIQTDIILVDVIAFSTLPDPLQYATAMIINSGIAEAVSLIGIPEPENDRQSILGVVPTGDGFYIILDQHLAGFGLLVALGLRNILLFKSRKFGSPYAGARASVHFGPATPFQDATGKENFIGSGLNDCARLQSLPSEQKKLGERFAKDANWVNISRECWNNAAHIGLYHQLKQQADFRISEEHLFRDKHGFEHICRFVDISRLWIA